MSRANFRRNVAFPALMLAAAAAAAYPLDGYEQTGIRRLEGGRLAQAGVVRDVTQPPGALLGVKDVEFRLLGQTFDLPAPDPAFTAQVTGLLAGGMDAYGLAVLDLTDPRQLRYTEHRADHRQNVGSVGKLLVALALFQALADAYPNDVETRRRVLKDTRVTADGFSQSDHHTVRFFDPVTRNGLALDMLRQASVFTASGEEKVPGPGESYGTARELMRYLLRMEQGRLVDECSSREIKRLIYVTENRIRYASSPALANAAVYFMSGSLFACAQEAGFTCKPYAGNVKN